MLVQFLRESKNHYRVQKINLINLEKEKARKRERGRGRGGGGGRGRVQLNLIQNLIYMHVYTGTTLSGHI